MLFVPLPFVAALLLMILCAQMRLREPRAGLQIRLLVLMLAVLATVIGVRWGYAVESVLPIQSLLASVVGPLSWLCFRTFVAERGETPLAHFWPHSLPTLLIAVQLVAVPQWIDLTLIAVFAFYAVALGRLAWAGPNALVLARFDDAPMVHLSLKTMAATLFLATIADTLISMDLRLFGGSFAATIVTTATVPLVLLLGVAAAIMPQNPSVNEPVAVQPMPASGDDADIVAKLAELMRAKELYRDHDLNLSRLARRIGIPGRRLSRAVNAVQHKNVSQYVNDFRIASACRLLDSADVPITSIVYDVGFLTKSNFNREFRRVTGMNPTGWRSRRTEIPDGRSVGGPPKLWYWDRPLGD